MPEIAFPVYTLQRWDDASSTWQDHGTFTTERGQENADYAVDQERLWETGPVRLLKDGVPILADDPATHGFQTA
ncbi:hypothetical protein [Streptomyces sp. NBC_00340]|uniref:hypothetical protein n=1 Tax=unclassified Streptomyces TaxID=2593676 RepID=UPI00225B18E0|nr:hypothetical protein [Streptomyces sp. NBC_00340]MCX5137638.1 hypothetical protein [Streptomyces sp. NBC_00340]